jgi:tRNA dimethylallyltransferase
MILIAILGQTSSGKSEIAVEIAKFYTQKGLNTWVINCDSRQVYKDLNTGTGKVEGFWLNNTDPTKYPNKKVYFYKKVAHFLIDYIKPQQNFGLIDYLKDFNDLFEQIQPDIVILCGGTGLYAKSIYSGQSYFETKPEFLGDYQKRREFYTSLPMEELQKKCQKMGLNQSDFNNKIRLTNHLLKQDAFKNNWINEKKLPCFEKKFLFGVSVGGEVLKEKIAKRLKQRVVLGLFDEFLRLKSAGVENSFWGKLGLEYRLCLFYYYGLISEKDWKSKLQSENLQYSKRQLTWFKKEPLIWKRNSLEILQYLDKLTTDG